MINRLFLIILTLFFITACAPADSPESFQLSSPNMVNTITFELIDGTPVYRVSHGDQMVLNNSTLGFRFKDSEPLYGNLEMIKSEETTFDETWDQVWGEKSRIRNHFNQLSVTLQETGESGRSIELQFRAYDDGVAFRYIYLKQDNDSLVIMDELTSFNLSEDGQAWWIGAYQDNRYEYLTNKSSVSTLDTVHTPLTIKSNSGLSLSFHEANLKNYASMTLARVGGTELKADLVPWADGDRVKTDGGFTTPWRTIQIAETPGELITSYLILNLNDPNELEDTSWIKPHKYLGIWWAMHIGKYSFWESPIQGATTQHAMEYIDYCKKLGIDHLLIEGWNKGWTPAWYENAMHMFSFTEEADNFDLHKVTDYARENGVSIIGYHETGSNIINYLKQIDAGMKLYQEAGIHDVKIGQVGSRLNMKEWHHGQFGVNYYRYVLDKAVEYQLTVNFHEPIKDTGERRTYPNMMSREGARGQEYNAWSEGNPPSHTATLPFTRFLAGPMDFTPGILDVDIKQGYEGRDVHTTAAKQLALYVVLYSPIQMLADLPENYDGNPAFKFLQDVPVDWEDTKVLNGEIGEYITTVRKDRYSDDWYLGSLTNEKSRSLQISLSFLDPNSIYEAQIYADPDGITWNKNASEVAISTRDVTASDTIQLKLAPGGGTAIRFVKK
ncbi:glycoside hydrolase family 97 protein [Fulvivirga sedimenti]|uniref:Glycoside hydrolase family 97 protein n=1 Tax=Fulvivirga sedimenti TaxID=2879465 RepID=A0A9X1L1T3_9BACT|nr:glycoside hydrolase family 97 protein [Fulvivirga sedimenti]MCA6075081.1 glycoside hydrolase family 97 protein [Fulvivirga sedimenti]MCA6076258.1 glycoside hydrolase family 97 protein [Fulvivirga sedimenti]MCA6077386.1 glycoside hydrolase family 97 protein [Fulvivirga sedimenti]